jgi:Fic family protein
LDGASRHLPNRDLFLGMCVRKEALLSSQIEGIECTLDEVFQVEEGVEPGGGSDMKDVGQVVNYVKAVNAGLEKLPAEDVSTNLLRELHGILLAGREGAGTFRDKQNWIGHPGSSLANATYVPPPVGRMHMALANLDYYLREYQGHAPIVRCAIAHAQLETIHPFIDGNGRVGRMMIALMLKELNVLSQPLLYPSLFLRRNRTEYYDRLTAVRTKGDWTSWIAFCATGLRQAAEEALATCGTIAALKAETEAAEGLPKNTRRTLELLFAHPILDANAVKRRLELGFDAASDALKRLEAAGWIEETTGKRRGRTYRFSRYIDILERVGDPN